MVIKYLIEKEFIQIWRNAFLPKIFVMLPVVMLLVVPYAANQEVKNLKFCVVDNDRSTLSERLVEKLDASEFFVLASVHPDYSHALECIEEGSADIILDIKKDFESDLVKNGVAEVAVSANTVNSMKGALGQSYMLQVISDYAARLGAEYGLEEAGVSMSGATIKPRFLFNEELEYKVFMVPAIIVMLLALIVGFLPALNIVGEKEKGTIEQINVTPVGRFEFVFSKMIPYWCIGLLMLTLSMIMAYIYYGMLPAAGFLPVYLFSTLFLLTISTLGLIVSNHSSTIQQAALLMFFFLVIFILMSGLLTPVTSMPDWARTLTYVNPLRYYVEVMRALYIKGSSFYDLVPQFAIMAVYGVLAFGWAIWSYRKSA